MPSLTFVLPHWLYWSGLVLFPLFAMYMVARARRRSSDGGVSLPLGYLFLVVGGFVGIHRFYLRSGVGFIFVALFGGILFTNSKFRVARNLVSEVNRDLLSAEFMVDRFRKSLTEGVDGAAEKFLKAQEHLVEVRHQVIEAASRLDVWETVGLWLFVAIGILILVDAILMPRLVRAQAEIESIAAGPRRRSRARATREAQAAPKPSGPRILRMIDALSGWTGTFVAYWSLVAVFVYFYEVLARYVLNSPTNWAHESMFLMFGMQYLIAGAMTLREDGHVRVDVIYSMLSPRKRATLDVITSVFFFLFTGTLLVTGWIFVRDSVNVWEVSFTEWGIQYWPVKATLVIGAFLIILQGFAKLVRDIGFATGKAGPE